MNEREKKGYVADASVRLKNNIGEKIAEIRQLVSVESKQMVECGGTEAAESILCALDCTYDQVEYALDSWRSAI